MTSENSSHPGPVRIEGGTPQHSSGRPATPTFGTAGLTGRTRPGHRPGHLSTSAAQRWLIGLGRATFPAGRRDLGRHHAEAVVVVAVVRAVVVTVGRAHVPGIVIERTTAQHPRSRRLCPSRRALRIGRDSCFEPPAQRSPYRGDQVGYSSLAALLVRLVCLLPSAFMT